MYEINQETSRLFESVFYWYNAINDALNDLRVSINGEGAMSSGEWKFLLKDSIGSEVNAGGLLGLLTGATEALEGSSNAIEGSGDVFSEWAKTKRADKISFLEPFINLAMKEQSRTGIPWQVTLAQIAYESGWGDENNKIYDEYTNEYSYNLFGIKYFGDASESSKFVRTWTTEYRNK